MEKDKKRVKILFGVLISGMIISASVLALNLNPQKQMRRCLEDKKYDKAVMVYNNRIIGTSDEKEFRQELKQCIVNTEKEWKQEEISYQDAVAILEVFQNVKDKELASHATESAKHIETEGYGARSLSLAKAHFEAEQYPEAMAQLKGIDSGYSLYEEVETLYESGRRKVLSQVEKQETMEEYEEDIAYLSKVLEKVEDMQLASRKSELEKEKTVFAETRAIIEKAEGFYQAEKYEKAFAVLEEGLAKYPGNQRLEEVTENYREQYVEEITAKAKTAYKNKEYKKALSIVDEAIKVYDCEELQVLRETVKKKPSLWEQWKDLFLNSGLFFGI